MSTPAGSLKFSFPRAALQFESTDSDWLVVTRNQAQYQVRGLLNGVAGYSFRVTALNTSDEETGRFRLRIWHYDTQKNEVVDYDSQAEGMKKEGTVVQDGNIRVSKVR